MIAERAVWPDGEIAKARAVRIFVRNLRRNLGDYAARLGYIFSKRKVGYRMPDPGERRISSHRTRMPPNPLREGEEKAGEGPLPPHPAGAPRRPPMPRHTGNASAPCTACSRYKFENSGLRRIPGAPRREANLIDGVLESGAIQSYRALPPQTATGRLWRVWWRQRGSVRNAETVQFRFPP